MASVLITGTSSGIGEACVARFSAAGWRVIATVRKAADADALRARYPAVTVLQVDLLDTAATAAEIGAQLERDGGVDVVVNNAGASIIGAVEELALDDFREQISLNLLAAIQVTQLALPYMRRQNAGRIIQVSSGFGRIALPMFSAYCASKFALEGFSEALSHEVLPFGIRVSLVEPGTVRTQLDANRRESTHWDAQGPYRHLYTAMRARLSGAHARRPSSAEDVAAVIFSAATVRKPALRYTVGRMGAGAALAARFVPEALIRVAVARALTRS
jgi:NAD(P)-dependent dehydrogenase (short-subunit alcohol dehydrogenase family)